MLWILLAEDRPDSGEVRASARPAHLEWAAASLDRIVRAGPLLADDGETMVGSLFVLDFPDRESVEAWAADDPYRAADLFESVTIVAWKETISRD